MSDPTFIIEQLDEALEERQGKDRRRANNGIDPLTGADRRKGDRRGTPEEESSAEMS